MLPHRFWREHDAALSRMWQEGILVPAIAEALGVTVGAVVGRRTRLKLPLRRPSYAPLSVRAKRANAKARNRAYWEAHRELLNANRRALRRAAGAQPAPPRRPKPVVLPEPEPVAGRAIPLLALNAHECRWPVSADAPFLFCAIAVASGSYCAYHAWKSLYHKEETADVRSSSHNRHTFQPYFNAYNRVR